MLPSSELHLQAKRCVEATLQQKAITEDGYSLIAALRLYKCSGKSGAHSRSSVRILKVGFVKAIGMAEREYFALKPTFN